MNSILKIALGGGCHWCTEAVFQALKGVVKVEQGYVASVGENKWFSEAIIVYFNEADIKLDILIEIHLHTHKSTSNHSMRTKYRSAVYYFSNTQEERSVNIIKELQSEFEKEIITKVLEFKKFKPSSEEFQNYYQSNPNKPFCKNYINPKLQFLLKKFKKNIHKSKVSNLNTTI